MCSKIGLLIQEASIDTGIADGLDKFQDAAKMFEEYLEIESRSSSDAQENDLFPKNYEHDQSSRSTENVTT